MKPLRIILKPGQKVHVSMEDRPSGFLLIAQSDKALGAWVDGDGHEEPRRVYTISYSPRRSISRYQWTGATR